jgi:general secretion pathway protein C
LGEIKMPRIAFSILQLGLVAGIILAVFAIVQKQMPPEDVPATEASSLSKPAQTPQDRFKPFAHYQIIAQRDLFQTPKDAQPEQAAIDIETLKPTALKLKLWGTITGEDGMTRAVIEDETQRQQAFYRAGEEVSSAQVKMILRDKVILSVKGEDQILEIEKPSGSARPAPSARPARVGSPPSAPNRPASPAPARRAVRLKLSRLGPISENQEDWGTYAATAPFKSDDGTVGLTLNRITPSSPLRRLGIRNGDVLLSIDDEPVSSLDEMVESLTEISAGDELRLKIKRRGRERMLDFTFE